MHRFGVLCAGAMMCLASPAFADTVDPDQRAAAQAVFDDARQLMSQKRYAEACPKLVESHRLDGSAMGTKFYLAECFEHIGKLASAWTMYLDVANDARKSGERDREKLVNERAAALKPRLPGLTVNVVSELKGTPGLVIKRDSVTVGEGQWGTAIPVDFGDHVITASIPGKKTWEGHVEAKSEAEQLKIEVPVLGDDESAPVVASVAASPWGARRRTMGWVAGSAGVVGIGIGSVLGAVAMAKKNASNADGHCDASNACDPTGHNLRLDAISAATGSSAAFIAGGIALAGGIVLVLTAPSSKGDKGDKTDTDPSETPGAVTPRFVFGLGSLSLVGSF